MDHHLIPPTSYHEKSYTFLYSQQTNTPNYCSKTTRDTLSAICEARMGRKPYPWQLDCAEAFILGIDCIVLAGTGYGKTLPFTIPSFLLPDKITIVISPLNALEEDQARRFREVGLKAAVVNHETFDNKLYEVRTYGSTDMSYQVIFTSPEMALKNNQFCSLLAMPAYHKRMIGIVIDEAHCISQWGGDFRPAYSELDKLRSFVPLNVPIYATTATMSPSILGEVRRVLHIDPVESFYLNLGNDRSNVTQECRTIPNATSTSALDFVYEGAESVDDLPRALIFVNKVLDSQLVWRRSQEILPLHLRPSVDYLNARRSSRSKKLVLQRFQGGQIRILVVTEIGGMGLDIPDITLVVQFGVPLSLTVWLQRAGRAGRSSHVQARAILLVELSALQRASANVAEIVSNENNEEEEGNVAYRKKVEPALREWVETEDCRRDVADKFFDNPPGRSPPTGQCCDNCTRKVMPPIPSPPSNGPVAPMTASIDIAEDEPSQHLNASGKRPMGSGAREGTRRAGEHLHCVRQALFQWRANTRKRDYPYCCFTGIALLPDGPLTTIASNRRLKVIDDLRAVLGTSWAFINAYGEEVLALVKKMDEDDKDIRAMKVLTNRQAKRQATDAAKAAQSQTTDTKPALNEGARRARGRPPRGKENIHQIPGMSRCVV
ncbi:P-loop containing nucleoside triphosphate hydrolase protein [Boletus edulis BED1]|uniref:DNA 3'-5' helicase n=1 Tax=Boletus edulis BED1 TaxID=1328754 RepID=A0AAD4C3R2_BOLED|nr:P-loop containing nucleoside triphosphate hydrolase protein [Boletus edulis BED1]